MITHSTSSVTVQAIPSKPGKQFVNPNDVQFEVKYPEGYAGPRLMPEGITTTSKESAALFTARGIGKVVEPSDQPAGDEKVVEVKTEATEPGTPTEETESSTTNDQPAGDEKKKSKKGK